MKSKYKGKKYPNIPTSHFCAKLTEPHDLISQ